MINSKYVVVIDDGSGVCELATSLFEKEKEYQFIDVNASRSDVKKTIKETVPDLIIINEDGIKEKDAVSMLNMINKEDALGGTPIIVVSSNEEKSHRIELMKRYIVNFIKNPINNEYFYYTIKSLVRLVGANRCISALTCLPRKYPNRK